MNRNKKQQTPSQQPPPQDQQQMQRKAQNRPDAKRELEGEEAHQQSGHRVGDQGTHTRH